MFKVGEGATPAIPETLSEEGQDFLLCCFLHDPYERHTADQLMDHSFVKVQLSNTVEPAISDNPKYQALCSPLWEVVAYELRFILSCHLYDNLRMNVFEDINRKNNHFYVLDDRSKNIFVNNVDLYICRVTAACIHSCMDYRQSAII